MVARRQRVIQLHRADDVPQRRRGKVLYRGKRVLYAVSQHLGVRHLKKDDGVYLHRDVVFRAHRLRHEVDDLLLDGDLVRDPVDEGQLDVQPRAPGAEIGAEALQDIDAPLRHDAHVGGDYHHQYEYYNRKQHC